jgi:ubiquinone/menaquinone biosynthesis C-methylase UbiE
MLKQILIYIIVFLVTLVLMRQVRKPHKWIGRPFVWIMNRSHSALTDWGLQHVSIEKHFTILDVGCGGGRTIEKLAAIATEGFVYGVDYAGGSVAASRARNRELIKAGRVEIHQASVSNLPFPDAKFDLVTAIETQYYWPDLPNDLKEIHRTLKPGGRLIVIAETFSGGRFDSVKGTAMKLLTSVNPTSDEQRELFTQAGYENIHISIEQRKGWICIAGTKAGADQSTSSAREAHS